jgi:hypothetical protein
MSTDQLNGDIVPVLLQMGGDHTLTEWSARLGVNVEEIMEIGLRFGIRFKDPDGPDELDQRQVQDPTAVRFPLEQRGKARSAPQDELKRLREALPGWEPVYESTTLSYTARHPRFRWNGLSVSGRDGDQLIARVHTLTAVTGDL